MADNSKLDTHHKSSRLLVPAWNKKDIAELTEAGADFQPVIIDLPLDEDYGKQAPAPKP